MTRANEPMLFVKIEDLSGGMEILVFPSLLKETAAIWREGEAVLCRGKLSDKDREIKLLCNKAAELTLENVEQAIIKFKKKLNCLSIDKTNLYIALNKNYNPDILSKLKELLVKHPGGQKVYFKIKSSNIETDFKVNPCESLIKEINHLLSKLDE